MSTEPDQQRQQQWELVVRRSFDISDVTAHQDARESLIGIFEGHLQANGWQLAPRGVAEPIVDSLLLLEVTGDSTDPTFDTRDGAHRLIAHGLSVIDPEHLMYDMRFDYPQEIVAAAQQMLARVQQYSKESSVGE